MNNQINSNVEILKSGVPVSARLPLFLLLLCCLHIAANAQAGPPGPSSPLYGARPSSGATSTGLPVALRDVGIDQRLNQELPLDLVFKDEQGRDVKLREYFGEKPVVLALVYYDCPMLCTQILNGMISTFRVLPFKAGKEFDVVTVSFDPREKHGLAAAKKKVYVDYLPESVRADATKGWHFLTGDESSIKQLTDVVGFRYHYDEATKQFAHASAIMVSTPQGKLSHYFYGIEYSARDLRLALVESSHNKIGSPVDQLILYCYHYDPATGKYGAVVMNVVRLAGVITVVAMIAMFFLLRRRNPARMKLKAGGAA